MSNYSVSLTYLRGENYSQRAGVVNDFLHQPRPLYSVAYIKRGCARFVNNNQEIRVGEGEVIFIPKGCRYRSVWEGERGTKFLSCFFDLTPFGEPIGNRIYGLQAVKGCSELRKDFEAVVLEEHDAFSAIDAMGRFFHILAYLFPRMRFDSYQTVDERIVNAVRYIESHYDTPLRVPELASACHISPSYFYECFKSQMGVSPIEYKNRILIAHARRSLIDHPETPIEELSERLGFESSIYFRRLFKRFTGKTPREYRACTKEEI